MSHVFGIDLGTTNSVIAHLVEGRPVAVPVEGSRIVPSVVLYEDNRVVVGREARNLEMLGPSSASVRSSARWGRPTATPSPGAKCPPRRSPPTSCPRSSREPRRPPASPYGTWSLPCLPTSMTPSAAPPSRRASARGCTCCGCSMSPPVPRSCMSACCIPRPSMWPSPRSFSSTIWGAARSTCRCSRCSRGCARCAPPRATPTWAGTTSTTRSSSSSWRNSRSRAWILARTCGPWRACVSWPRRRRSVCPRTSPCT